MTLSAPGSVGCSANVGAPKIVILVPCDIILPALSKLYIELQLVSKLCYVRLC